MTIETTNTNMHNIIKEIKNNKYISFIYIILGIRETNKKQVSIFKLQRKTYLRGKNMFWFVGWVGLKLLQPDPHATG